MATTTIVEPCESWDGMNFETTEFFAPERSFETHRIAEALETGAAKIQYSRADTAVEQISSDNHLTFGFHGQRFRLMEKAFDDLCKLFIYLCPLQKRFRSIYRPLSSSASRRSTSRSAF
jgi:hypothetical protein